MDDVYVKLSTARLLKKKGFNVRCHSYYINGRKQMSDFKRNFNSWEGNYCFSRPTQALVMKWLREKFDYNIQIMLDSWSETYGSMGYYIVINQKNGELEDISPIVQVKGDNDVFFNKYEDAVEAAIVYCLKELVK